MASKGLFRLWGWLKVIKDDAILLFYAWKHPHTPAYIKGMLLALLAYVFSPVDFIPDFLPVLGITDDAAIIPAAILYLTHLLPPSVRRDCQYRSGKWSKRIPWLLGVIVFCVLAWIVLAIFGLHYIFAGLTT